MENYKFEEKVSKFEEIDLSGTYSYADYLKWEFDDRVELIEGKVFPMGASPGSLHQQISGSLLGELYNYLKSKSFNIFTAPFDVRFPRHSNEDQDILTVLQPDLSIFCDRSKIDERGGIGAPDIVVEILSPGDNQKELHEKCEVYEEAGVLEYWIIFPATNIFFKYTLDAEGKFQPTRLLTFDDEVTSPVLPGFRLILNEVFEDSFQEF